MTGYKLFEMDKKGLLHPLFIGKDRPTPVGVWVDAEAIETKGFAFRPGWHIGTIPDAPWLRSADGTYKAKRKDHVRVWAQCTYSSAKDWQKEADSSKNGSLPFLPTDGCYIFKEAGGRPWIIAGRLKVEKVLTDDEVDRILASGGYDKNMAFEPYRSAFMKRAETIKKKKAHIKGVVAC